MIQLGEKVSFIATYKSEKYVKNDWRVCVFQTIVDTTYFPGRFDNEELGTTRNFLAKGVFSPAYIGEVLELTGEWEYSKNNKEYQFSVEIAVPNVPSNKDEALAFIRHSVKGIGPKLSGEIITWCKGDLTKISESPRVLAASIKGLSERKTKLIAARIDEASTTSALTKLLKTVIEPKTIRKLVNAYGRSAYDTITRKPYDTIGVIGFDAADKIALAQDFQPNKPERVEGAAIAALNALRSKYCAIIVSKELHRTKMRLLLDSNVPKNAVKSETMDRAIYNLKQNRYLAGAGNFYYLREDWEMEKTLAQRIYNLGQNIASEPEAARFCSAFDLWKDRNPSIKLHVNQSDAVYSAANLFSVVTGGPGTGKTTVLKAIMETYTILYPDSPITLMAPTGLAAKRMTESCERKAHTIYKALGLTPADTPSGFESSRGQKIHGGLIIVDEFSMVGIHLANFLLSAIEIRPDTRIVFVGDVDQLPPVTPGCVLRDLIECRKVHVTRLTKNFRQANGSSIADIAIKVNTGNAKGMKFQNDCLFSQAQDDRVILDMLLAEFQQSILDYGLEQTYVITPTHKSVTDCLSSNSLNKRLQELVNPKDNTKNEVIVGDWVFRVGDRVINRKNTDDVVNGDIGVITELIPEDVGVSLKVDFSGNDVLIPPERLKNLELAYAITVHSSQGCEFKSVITPISKNHKFMLTRNLVYTAITRAKVKMHLIGDKSEMEASVVNIRSGAPSDLLRVRIAKINSVVSLTETET